MAVTRLVPDAISRHVVPLVLVDWDANPDWISGYAGTAFFPCANEYLLTAAHCLDGKEIENLGVLHPGDGDQWTAFQVSEVESHPQHDLAVLRLRCRPKVGATNMFRFSKVDVRSSFKYMLWGYPDDAARDRVEAGVAILLPDLVYSEGHVRRRLQAFDCRSPRA
jgi:hypothetical protein